MTLSRRAVRFVHEMQEHVTTAIERVDGGSRFRFDDWERAGGGGGRTGMLTGGAVFEKAGVNVSEVWGELKPEFAATLPGDGLEFFATGLSVVVHPPSPMVPAMHANIRFLCDGSASWFGGGRGSRGHRNALSRAHRRFAGERDRHHGARHTRQPRTNRS